MTCCRPCRINRVAAVSDSGERRRVANESRVLFWRLAETIFRKVRDDETSSPTRETRALPGVLIAARNLRSFALPIPENRERKLRHCHGQSYLRILGPNLAIAENIAQIRQIGW